MLNNNEYRLAQFKDSNRGLWTAKDRLTEKRLSRDIQMLTLMYAEAVKNKEIAEFSLKSSHKDLFVFLWLLVYIAFSLEPAK